MKKVLLSVIALASFTVATAQDGLKGTWWASCQVGMQKSENGKAESTNTTILPLAGYFVSPSVTVGAAVGMINVDTKNVVATGVDLESKLIVIQPLVRKYWNVNGGLFFFGQLATPIITGTSEFNTTALKDVKVSQFGATMSGGFDYVVNKWFTVEFSYNLANLSFTTIKDYPGTTEDIKVTDFSLAHVATVDSEYNGMLFGSSNNAVTPLSFGFKFLF